MSLVLLYVMENLWLGPVSYFLIPGRADLNDRLTIGLSFRAACAPLTFQLYRLQSKALESVD